MSYGFKNATGDIKGRIPLFILPEVLYLLELGTVLRWRFKDYALHDPEPLPRPCTMFISRDSNSAVCIRYIIYSKFRACKVRGLISDQAGQYCRISGITSTAKQYLSVFINPAVVHLLIVLSNFNIALDFISFPFPPP